MEDEGEHEEEEEASATEEGESEEEHEGAGADGGAELPVSQASLPLCMRSGIGYGSPKPRCGENDDAE